MEEVEKSFGESLADSALFIVLSFFFLYSPETLSFRFLIVLFFPKSFADAILSALYTFIPLFTSWKLLFSSENMLCSYGKLSPL